MTLDNECSLRINAVDINRHFGDWICVIEDFSGQSVSAKIVLGKPQPAEVEFEDYFGTVNVDLGKEKVINLQCNAKPKEKGTSLTSPPGQLTFKVANNELSDASEWQQVLVVKHFIFYKSAAYFSEF